MGQRLSLGLLLLIAAQLQCAGARQGPAPAPAGQTHDAPPTLPAQPIPADLREGIERAEEIGSALYLQDKASAIATDVLFARVNSPEKLELGGYITVREGDDLGRPKPSWLTVFYSRADEPRILYRIHIPMKPGEAPTLEQVDPPESPSASLKLLITARRTAIAALTEITQPINPEILPGPVVGEEGILIYLLAGTKRSNVAVLGRHYRVLVSADGRQVKKFEPLSKAVLELPLSRPAGDSKPVALTVSHVLTEAPIESHVLVSKQWKIPIYVSTRRGDWCVDDGRISFLGERGEL